jgi:tetratricopeptide (TPR) repeat protein
MVVKLWFCTLAAVAAFVCAIGGEGWALVDKPVATFQRDLLDLAFETATAIPMRPHLKDRSKTQEAVVAASLELDQPRRALTYLQKIDNWRRGASYADLALYSARHGETDKAHDYLERAAQIARDPEVQDWRRDRIRVKIANAYLWLGQTRQAEQFETGVVVSEAGKVAQVKATLGNPQSFPAQLEALDAFISQGGYDLTKNALDAYAVLFDRFYADPKRRSHVEAKINASIDKLPVWFRVHLLMTLAKSAWAHSDQAKAIELLNRAQTMADAHQWPPRYGLPLKARLAEHRAQLGDKHQARADADAALVWFDAVRQHMFDIERAAALRPLAEAYQAIGDAAAALAVYRRAVEEGAVNPNARPKAEDLSATCRSMALHGVEPDEALWTRLRQIHSALGPPW